MTTTFYSDLHGLESKLEVAEQALADVTRREQSLMAKLRVYEALGKLPATLLEGEVQLEEKRIAGEKADLLRRQQEAELARRIAEIDQRDAELRRRQAEMETVEKETLAAQTEAGVLHKYLARARAELDAGMARLSAAADGIVRAQRETRTARAEVEQRSAALEEQAAALERQRTVVVGSAPDDGANTPKLW